jgi:hypothetical protein
MITRLPFLNFATNSQDATEDDSTTIDRKLVSSDTVSTPTSSFSTTAARVANAEEDDQLMRAVLSPSTPYGALTRQDSLDKILSKLEIADIAATYVWPGRLASSSI